MSQRQFPERLIAVFDGADSDDLTVAEDVNGLAHKTGPYGYRNAAYYVLAGTGRVLATAAKYVHHEPRPTQSIINSTIPVQKD